MIENRGLTKNKKPVILKKSLESPGFYFDYYRTETSFHQLVLVSATQSAFLKFLTNTAVSSGEECFGSSLMHQSQSPEVDHRLWTPLIFASESESDQAFFVFKKTILFHEFIILSLVINDKRSH